MMHLVNLLVERSIVKYSVRKVEYQVFDELIQENISDNNRTIG